MNGDPVDREPATRDLVLAMMQTGKTAEMVLEGRRIERERLAALGWAVDDDPLFAVAYETFTTAKWNDLVIRLLELEASAENR